MFSYLACGLKIRASFPLPDLPLANVAAPDVIIRRGTIDRPHPQTSADGSFFSLSGNEAYLYWDEVGGFLVRDGREIIVDQLTMTEDHIVRLPLLGTVLSAAVCQRGFPGFHGSAVSINGQAVAFLGHRGCGKSTTAAMLYARGHDLLTDDLVVVSDLDGADGPAIVPSFPQLKLFPEAAAASLGDAPETLPRLIDGFEKRARRVEHGFAQQPVPLRAIYLLANDPQLAVEQISPQETMAHILCHSYTARIFNKSLTGSRAAGHFRQCAELIRRVPVWVLKKPVALDKLSDVAALIESHVGQAR